MLNSTVTADGTATAGSPVPYKVILLPEEATADGLTRSRVRFVHPDHLTEDDEAALITQRVAREQSDARPRFSMVMANELAEPVPPMEWLVEGVWAKDSFGPIGGEKKTLKSYNMLAMGVAVASGEPMFDEFAVPHIGPVLYYVGEGGQKPFRRRYQAVCKRYGVDPRELGFAGVFDVGALDSTEFISQLRRNLDELQPSLVIVDPLYAYHPAGIEAQNLYERGRMLAEIEAEVRGHGSFIIADHFKKTGSADLDLDSIAQAGMGQWADSWILQVHREKPDLENGAYRLTAEFGSRQWGGAQWDIDWTVPGPQDLADGVGVDWSVQRSERTEPAGGGAGIRQQIEQVLHDCPFERTKTQIKESVGGNDRKIINELNKMIAEGAVEVRSVERQEGNRNVKRDRVGLRDPAVKFPGVGRVDE